MPLFDGVSVDVSREFHKDCEVAGIERTDSRGRVIDVHALRGTFASLLVIAGTPLAIAQKLMRHSDPKLTQSAYVSLGVQDLARAVDSLPSFTASASAHAVQNVANLVAPTVAPKSGKTWCNETKFGNQEMFNPNSGTDDTDRILTNKDNGLQEETARKPLVGEAGVEPASLAAADFKSAVYAIPPLAPMRFVTSPSLAASRHRRCRREIIGNGGGTRIRTGE